MTISALNLFSIGIGPSSSHTVGPMRAAGAFVHKHAPTSVRIVLRGSLAATGRGHGTDRAVVLGLAGYEPASVDPEALFPPGAAIPVSGSVDAPNGQLEYSIEFDATAMPAHPNAVSFFADGSAEPTETYYSVGGGFIVSDTEYRRAVANADSATAGPGARFANDAEVAVPFPFTCAADLVDVCQRENLSIADTMLANEIALARDNDHFLADSAARDHIHSHLDTVWETMQLCIDRGLHTDGVLPGGLGVPRRAPTVVAKLREAARERNENTFSSLDPLHAMEWVNVFALAVNEENAAGGRVVTAPTNGAAGIIPAVMHYAKNFRPGFDREAARKFLLTAAAVGNIIKENASISGAEVGCQGEVGSASAMAAAALCSFLGGSVKQVENAAEIALEHSLGLTCDPVGGLVQIPCIERNAMASVGAINAARFALLGDGTHSVSLDQVMKTMDETGRDMLSKYKETAAGGLAATLGLRVNMTEC